LNFINTSLFGSIYTVGDLVYNISWLCIPITVSIYSGLEIATTNKFLGQKLIEVQTLSSEKQEILENQKTELEKQVTERTLELKETNEELHSTNDELHKKNEDITASITYAKRIQTAMLPRIDDIQKALPESFILFKPRDIVSGDFYYFKEISPTPNPSPQERGIDSLPAGEGWGGAKIIIACADCTGHGVPGAFMSMIGNEILTNIVEIQGITSPDLILNELHKNIRAALKQGETENRDGMDISIVLIDKQKQIFEYAGAMNPLYYIQNGELHEIKADKFPIGGSQKEKERTFTKHEIQLRMRNDKSGIWNEVQNIENQQPTVTNHQQTVFYLCSDGFQDQFGGAQGKKFMVKKFRELLFTIHHLPMYEQKQILDSTIEQWMAEGKESQIDDILVMGIRI
jgi:serine phosphatase RsbU (regulator of sigma subunit)